LVVTKVALAVEKNLMLEFSKLALGTRLPNVRLLKPIPTSAPVGCRPVMLVACPLPGGHEGWMPK